MGRKPSGATTESPISRWLYFHRGLQQPDQSKSGLREKHPMSTTPTLGIGITTDVSAVADAVTETEKLAAQIQSEENTPKMIKAAEAQKKLDAEDALVVAQKANDLKAEQLAAENAGQ